MAITILLLLFASPLLAIPVADGREPTSKIAVVGIVFCDTCSTNTFSKQSYFLQGVKVQVECNFKTSSTKQVYFSSNKTTNQFGIYKLELPAMERFSCIQDGDSAPSCKASLLGSSFAPCSVLSQDSSTQHMILKSKQANKCIYSLNALSYRPPKIADPLCETHQRSITGTLNDSKSFLAPSLPLERFPFPPYPHLPPLPPLDHFPFPPFPHLPPFPPWDNFPLPPFPHFPPLPLSPFPKPPTFPFPMPPFPTFPPSPPPPVFSLKNPTSQFPSFAPSPPKHPQNHRP